MRIDYGKIGFIPLTLVGIFWTFVFGFGGIDYNKIVKRSILSFDIKSTILIDISLVLMVLPILFPHSKLRLYLGRIGSIIWVALLSYPTMMIMGEPYATSRGFLLIYLIVVVSTALVIISLWKKGKDSIRGGGLKEVTR